MLTVEKILNWALYLLILFLYLKAIKSYYSSNQKPVARLSRLIAAGEEQRMCSQISTEHLERVSVPNYIYQIHEAARQGFIIVLDDDLLRLQPDLLRWLDHRVRVLLCDSPLISLLNTHDKLIKNVKAQIRWVDVNNSGMPCPLINTYKYQQETNLFTILFISHQSSSLLEANKAGLKTMAVTI